MSPPLELPVEPDVPVEPVDPVEPDVPVEPVDPVEPLPLAPVPFAPEEPGELSPLISYGFVMGVPKGGGREPVAFVKPPAAATVNRPALTPPSACMIRPN